MRLPDEMDLNYESVDKISGHLKMTNASRRKLMECDPLLQCQDPFYEDCSIFSSNQDGS